VFWSRTCPIIAAVLSGTEEGVDLTIAA